MTNDVIIVLILVGAAFIRGSFGFGDALFAMPLLVLILPKESAAPLAAMTALLIAVVIILREWKDVEIKPAALLIMAAMTGVPVGVWLLRTVDERVVKSVLGIMLIGFSGWSLWRPNTFTLKTDRAAPVFGICAGILGGAFNTSGPPLVIFASLRRWPPRKFRAMMQACCLVGSPWVIAVHGAFGHINRQTFTHLAMAAPFIVIATLVGQRLTAQLAIERFVRAVFGLLILLGFALLASSLSFLR